MTKIHPIQHNLYRVTFTTIDEPYRQQSSANLAIDEPEIRAMYQANGCIITSVEIIKTAREIMESRKSEIEKYLASDECKNDPSELFDELAQIQDWIDADDEQADDVAEWRTRQNQNEGL